MTLLALSLLALAGCHPSSPSPPTEVTDTSTTDTGVSTPVSTLDSTPEDSTPTEPETADTGAAVDPVDGVGCDSVCSTDLCTEIDLCSLYDAGEVTNRWYLVNGAEVFSCVTEYCDTAWVDVVAFCGAC